MNISTSKLKAMILYFATFSDLKFLGKVKLMKLFYFSDFIHTKKYASPITYDNYIHLEHGPVPSTILNLVNSVENDMDNAILSDTILIEMKDGCMIKRIIPTRKFEKKDEKYFTKSELSTLEEVCKRFSAKNTKYIEDASHNESAWKKTDELEEIPYTLAVGDPDCLVDEEEIKLALEILKD